MKRRLFLVLAALSAVALLAAACGDGPDPVPTPTATKAPATPTSAPTAAKIGKKRADVENNPNVKTTASGLKYVDNVVGTGASPSPTSSVTINYVGTVAATGAQFDSSIDRGTPATFPMANVIKGFSEGLSTMKVGGKRTVLIPAALGYGAAPPSGSGIPVNADLVFDIELISIQ